MSCEQFSTRYSIGNEPAQWRYIPNEFPKWTSVRSYFDKCSEDSTWVRVNDALRQQVHTHEGCEGEPSAGVIDAQSVKTTELGGESGYDAEKRVKRRTRTLVVDTLGLVLRVLVHSAASQDSEGAAWLLANFRKDFPTPKLMWVDSKKWAEIC